MTLNGSHIAAPTLVVAYHSGFGHTAVLAEAWPRAYGTRVHKSR